MALEFAAEAYEKEIWEIDEPADGESDPDEEKKEPEDRLIMKIGSLIKYLTEKKTEGIQAEKLAYIFHQKLAGLITDGCRKIRKKTKCNCIKRRCIPKSAVVENGGRRSGKRTFYRTQTSPDPGK